MKIQHTFLYLILGSFFLGGCSNREKLLSDSDDANSANAFLSIYSVSFENK